MKRRLSVHLYELEEMIYSVKSPGVIVSPWYVWVCGSLDRQAVYSNEASDKLCYLSLKIEN